MRMRSFGLMAITTIGLMGCDIEAGANPDFPPIGGRSQATLPPPPNTFLPAETPTDDDMTASLSDAVNAALAATAAIEPIPESGVTTPRPAARTPRVDPVTGEVIASDDGVLNLSLFTQEEQRIAREADAAAIQAAAAQRVVIAPGQMPEVVANVNIIAFARSSTNNVGERVVRRPRIQRTNSRRECAKFNTSDNAQRNFLANGGPAEDPLNLDPDGDGFACNWSPEAYRALNLN